MNPVHILFHAVFFEMQKYRFSHMNHEGSKEGKLTTTAPDGSLVLSCRKLG